MTLAPVFLGSLARRRVATLFSFVAVALGVALGMGVQAVHEAALSEFGRGLRAMAWPGACWPSWAAIWGLGTSPGCSRGSSSNPG